MGANGFLSVYDRYKTQLDKEDELINNRVKWLLGTQTILFAAIKVTSSRPASEILEAVSVVGLASSSAIGISTLAAILSFLKYRKNLLRKYESVKIKIGQTDSPQQIDYPQLNRSGVFLLIGHVAAITLPVIFVLGWSLMIGGLSSTSQPPLMEVLLMIGYIAAIALPVIFGLGWFFIEVWPILTRQRHYQDNR